MRKAVTLFGTTTTALLVVFSLANDAVTAQPRVQSVKIKITEQGFEPVTLKVRKGVRVRVTVIRTTDRTCAKEIVFPDFNLRRELPLDRAVVVNVTPPKSGNLSFVCGMNMMRGQLIAQ